jgi:prevent-host-death family protein
MREIGAFEAKNTLGSLLDEVERGEEITITRRGKPVARLISVDTLVSRERALAALQEVKALRRGVSLGPDATLRSLIDEGRS